MTIAGGQSELIMIYPLMGFQLKKLPGLPGGVQMAGAPAAVKLPGPVVSGLAAATWGGQRQDVFAVNPSGNLVHKWTDGGDFWSSGGRQPLV